MVTAAERMAGSETAARAGKLPVDRWWRGRRAALGTMHGKEQVIGPILAADLGIEVVVPAGFESDRFGTFTRDVPRAGDQLEAARRKARTAMAESGLDLGLASEGSFGPHPALPWLAANLELVVLIDGATGIELVGRHLTTEAVSGHAWVASAGAAVEFAGTVGFPDHALVVRRGPEDARDLVKGVAAEATLRSAVERLIASAPDGRVFLESDLRADRNPTRMAAIAEAARHLVENARRGCPACATPGFEVVDQRAGLPCAWCRQPTDLTLALVYGCQRCGARSEAGRPDGRTEAEPGECPNCNP